MNLSLKGAVEMFLSEAIDDFFAYARAELGHTQKTLLTYRSRQRQFATWLTTTVLPDAKVEDVSAQHIWRYTYSRSGQGLRPRSIRGVMNALRTLYAYLVQMGAVTANPALEVKIPKLDAAERLLVGDEELMKLLAATEQQRQQFRVLRDKALLSVLIFCGLRRQELPDLKLRDVNLDGKFILVEQGKGQKSVSAQKCWA
jgi:site-specific recombinase XerD